MEETPKPRFIYFVRHGESEGNVGSTVQRSTEPLTKRGREQAVHLGRRILREIPVEHILASTMARAMETAQIIADECSFTKDIEYLGILGERHTASEFHGVEREDEHYKTYDRAVVENWDNPQWRHSDEEGFFDLKARSQKALGHLAELPYKHTVVVTHGLFLRFLIGSILFKDEFTPRDSVGLIHAMRTQNTGITVAEYDLKNTGKGWLLLTFNDYAHLPK